MLRYNTIRYGTVIRYLQHIFILLYLSTGDRRTEMGIRRDWSATSDWLNPYATIFFPPPATRPALKKKCPDIVTLPTYSMPPPQSFWRAFPYRPFPTSPVCRIDYGRRLSLAQTAAPFSRTARCGERTVQYGTYSLNLPPRYYTILRYKGPQYTIC